MAIRYEEFIAALQQQEREEERQESQEDWIDRWGQLVDAYPVGVSRAYRSLDVRQNN